MIGSDTFHYTEPITLIGVFFLVMSADLAAGVRWLERRVKGVHR